MARKTTKKVTENGLIIKEFSFVRGFDLKKLKLYKCLSSDLKESNTDFQFVVGENVDENFISKSEMHKRFTLFLDKGSYGIEEFCNYDNIPVLAFMEIDDEEDVYVSRTSGVIKTECPNFKLWSKEQSFETNKVTLVKTMPLDSVETWEVILGNNSRLPHIMCTATFFIMKHSLKDIFSVLVEKILLSEKKEQLLDDVLYVASSNGCLWMLNYLEKKKINIITTGNSSPMYYACLCGNMKTVKFLVKKGVNFRLHKYTIGNYHSEDKEWALKTAIFFGNFEVAKFLCQNGALVENVPYKVCSLHSVLSNRYRKPWPEEHDYWEHDEETVYDMVEFLIKEDKSIINYKPSMITAITKYGKPMIDLFIKSGFDIALINPLTFSHISYHSPNIVDNVQYFVNICKKKGHKIYFER